MSDMHVLTGSKGRWQVRCHVAVPADARNDAVPSVSFRTALVKSERAVTALVQGDGEAGTISVEEKAAVEAGEIFEFPMTVLLESGGAGNATRIATARAKYAAVKAQRFAAMQKQLRYFGQTLEATP